MSCSSQMEWGADGPAASLEVGVSTTTKSWSAEEKISLSSDGQVLGCVELQATDLEGQQTLAGSIEVAVNTKESPLDDSVSAALYFDRSAAYGGGRFHRSANGSSSCIAESGVRFFNGILGVDVSREIASGPWIPSVALGFQHESFTIAGKLTAASEPQGSVVTQRFAVDHQFFSQISLGDSDCIRVGFTKKLVFSERDLQISGMLDANLARAKLTFPMWDGTVDLGFALDRVTLRPSCSIGLALE